MHRVENRTTDFYFVHLLPNSLSAEAQALTWIASATVSRRELYSSGELYSKLLVIEWNCYSLLRFRPRNMIDDVHFRDGIV